MKHLARSEVLQGATAGVKRGMASIGPSLGDCAVVAKIPMRVVTGGAHESCH